MKGVIYISLLSLFKPVCSSQLICFTVQRPISPAILLSPGAGPPAERLRPVAGGASVPLPRPWPPLTSRASGPPAPSPGPRTRRPGGRGWHTGPRAPGGPGEGGRGPGVICGARQGRVRPVRSPRQRSPLAAGGWVTLGLRHPLYKLWRPSYLQIQRRQPGGQGGEIGGGNLPRTEEISSRGESSGAGSRRFAGRPVLLCRGKYGERGGEGQGTAAFS
jgi:hypothetical protein